MVRPYKNQWLMVCHMADISDERREIGKRIRIARKDAGVPIEKIAERFELQTAACYHWETGVSMPTADQLRELCRMLEVSADKILTGVSSWPYELFQPDDYAMLSDQERTNIEDSIAGAILRKRRKQIAEAA